MTSLIRRPRRSRSQFPTLRDVSFLPGPFEDVFDTFFNEFMSDTNRVFSLVGDKSTYPKMDVHRDNEGLTFELAVPGLKQDDVQVEIENGILSVKYTKTEKKEDKGEPLLRELKHSSWTRQVSLGDNLDEEKISADLADGILTLRLPFKTPIDEPKNEVRQIPIGNGQKSADSDPVAEVAEE